MDVVGKGQEAGRANRHTGCNSPITRTYAAPVCIDGILVPSTRSSSIAGIGLDLSRGSSRGAKIAGSPELYDYGFLAVKTVGADSVNRELVGSDGAIGRCYDVGANHRSFVIGGG